jgi:hypothetical protein
MSIAGCVRVFYRLRWVLRVDIVAGCSRSLETSRVLTGWEVAGTDLVQILQQDAEERDAAKHTVASVVPDAGKSAYCVQSQSDYLHSPV